MHWIVLALCLAAIVVSLLQSAFMVFQLMTGGGSVMIGDSVVTWMTNILFMASIAIALIGAILAFNKRKVGGVFIIAAALICLFAHDSTRNYGWIYLVGGALAFFVRKSPDDYDEEDNEFEDEFDDDDDEEEERDGNIFAARARSGERGGYQEFPYGDKRKERASRMKLNREDYSVGGESLRIRSSKVCPACSAGVGAGHKFCYTCGGLLRASRTADADLDVATDFPQPQRSSPGFRDFQVVSPVDGMDKDEEDAGSRRGSRLSRYDSDDEEELEGDSFEDRAVEDIKPHRVYKPSKDDEIDFNPSYIDGPDSSYQEFSNYTRRRKRRRNSLAHRALAPLLLLLIVSGTAWMLFGGRGDPVIPDPLIIPIVPDPYPGPNGREDIPVPRPSVWEQIQIEAPTRGVVTGSSVNVRQGHSTATQVITRLSAGAQADVIGQWVGVSGAQTGPWFNIRTGGRDGWIYGQFFQPLDGRQATLPPGATNDLLEYFGSNVTELINRLGQPTSHTPAAMTWPGLTAEISNGVVVRLQITGPQHALQERLVVGMTADDLYMNAGYASNFAGGQLRYLEIGGGPQRGMAVRLQNGRVQSITVGNI